MSNHMCEKCDNINNWKFCPYCGHELPMETPEDKPEITQEKFDEIFLDMIRTANKVVWLKSNGSESDIPTCNFELRNDNNEWMFRVRLNSEKPLFYYSYWRVFEVFHNQYGLQKVDIQRLMQKQMKLLFNMTVVTPPVRVSW